MNALPTARIVGLDLLRGVAIGLVLLRHALPEIFPGAGVVGVVMFFALSGHLITGVLLTDHERHRRIRLRRFYLRRALRLLPALITVVGAVAVVTLLLDPLDDRAELPRTVVVALTWTANLPFDQGSDAIFHLWTLATEEQFYLVWPAILGWALARGRVGHVLLAAAAACLLACLATLVWLWEAPDLAYALPTSWAVCFVIGSASRIHVDRLRIGPALAAGALLTLIVLALVPLRGHPSTYLVAGPLVAVCTTVLIARWRSSPPAAERLGPLLWLGTISYGAYLWNYPLTLWLRPLHPAYGGLLAAVLTIALAALTWRWIEQPVLARRDRRAIDAKRHHPAATSGLREP